MSAASQAGAALLIFPCNGNAIEALDCLGAEWTCVGFVDDATQKQGGAVYGIPVHDRTAFERWPLARVLAVPGSPDSFAHRRRAIESLALPRERFATVVHPSAQISPRARIGFNTLVMAGAVVTSGADVGSHCCILPNTVVHHDASIGDWTLVGASVTVAGGVRIGSNCYIGSASSIRNGVRIGDFALVGMGANVVADVDEDSRVAGNPARILRAAAGTN